MSNHNTDLICDFFVTECRKMFNPSSKTYSSKKLSATFEKRTNYVTHYRNLILYLRLGMKLTKVRRVLAFKQSAFLIPYIEKCTELRQNSNNDFAKGLWKLFANAVFGKFIESVRNYLDVAICFNAEDCERHISKPNFSNIKIISKDVVLVFSKKPTATLNKCYAVGFAVLDLAKEFMYRKYYDEIKPKLGDCQIVMSDTDSFIISVSSDTPTDNLKKIAHILDLRMNYVVKK